MSDVTLPNRHIRPQQGWLNDPNGVCRVDGRWHVFFQHQPNGPRHHRIAWGHVSSEDLVTWREEPLALIPADGALNSVGSWSGSCTVDDGVPTLCFTAVDGSAADAVGAVATSGDGLRSWRLAIRPSAPRVGIPSAETRDPFVVEIDGGRYIVQGHGGPQTTAQVLVYDATDLTDWQLLGTLLDVEDPVASRVAAADIWECPNLLLIDGCWVLLVSLWRLVDGQGQLTGVRWLTGDLTVVDGCPCFSARDGGVLDEGPAFYAPQATTADGRTLLWGWSWELGRSEEWLDEHGWAGVLTAPRELHMRGGRLVAEPAPEFLAHAGDELGTSWSVDEEPAAVVTVQEAGRLVCDAVDGGLASVDLPAGATVLVDGSLVEVFWPANTHTTRVYPLPGAHWHVASSGPVSVRRLG